MSASSSSVATKRMTAPRGSRRLALVGGLLLLALAVATVVVIALDAEPSTPADVNPTPPPAEMPRPAPPPAIEPPATAPPPAETTAPAPTTDPTTAIPPSVPPPADRVMLHVVTDPPGATVVLDGVRLGTSPFTAEVPIKQGGAWLKVRKKHHLPVKIRVSLEADVTWDVTLPARR